jgi:hypothetical protein
MFEDRVLPERLRPMLKAFRGKAIKLLEKKQDQARYQHNDFLLDYHTNSLKRLQSEEL